VKAVHFIVIITRFFFKQKLSSVDPLLLGKHANFTFFVPVAGQLPTPAASYACRF
jgi:hypothetical protein